MEAGEVSILGYEAAAAHRNEVARRLAAELSKHGVASKIDGVMGACYVDIEGHKGFTLEIMRQHIRTGRPYPNGVEYTGRTEIVYQGFGENTATEVVEPDSGFDFALVAAEIVQSARASSGRAAVWEAKKAAAQKDAAILEKAILDEFAGDMDSDPSVHVTTAQTRDGEWVPWVEIKIGGLTAEQAREILDFARTIKGRPAK